MYELFVFLSLNSNFQYFHAKSSNFTTQTKVSPTAALNVYTLCTSYKYCWGNISSPIVKVKP